MRRNYRHIFSTILVVLSGIFAFAQEVEYKDVILDGKPAQLNLKTGEITVVKSNNKKKPIKFNDSITLNKKDSVQSTNTNGIIGLHVVQEGETLLDISKYYKVSLETLKTANNLQTTIIDKGQVLQVKNFDSDSANVSQVRPKANYQAFKELNTSGFHVVKKGETLYSIAQRYNLDLDDIKHFNNLKSNIISVGQRLRLTTMATSKVPQNVGDGSIWTVSKGDTLYSIAKKNGTTIETIKRLNGLTDDTILIGQKLRLK